MYGKDLKQSKKLKKENDIPQIKTKELYEKLMKCINDIPELDIDEENCFLNSKEMSINLKKYVFVFQIK